MNRETFEHDWKILLKHGLKPEADALRRQWNRELLARFQSGYKKLALEPVDMGASVKVKDGQRQYFAPFFDYHKEVPIDEPW